MNRREIHFPLKDAGLREDVGTLGALVGEVIREQAGERLLTEVESARRVAIQRRLDDSDSTADLCEILSGVDDTTSFIRAYSIFFQVVNLAERVHHIRRRRDYLRSTTGPQPGGVEEALQQLARAGVGLERFDSLLERIRLEPVFTAHPTETTRRSILQKHLRIARRLVERLDPSLTPHESRRSIARIRSEITALWQTEEHPESGRTINDESEYILFFLSEILYRVVPPFYEALEDAISSVYGQETDRPPLPTLLRFGSWAGGDMDGNPNVTAETLHSTLLKHRSTVLDTYRRELDGLYQQLTQSQANIGFTDHLQEKIRQYETLYPGSLDQLPERHTHMPYRRLIRLMQKRLRDTASNGTFPYPDAEAFIDDISSIAESLKQNAGENAGLFLVERLLRRAQTFEFHLATLDIRQDSLTLRNVVGAILNDPQWSDRTPDDRTERLTEALHSASPALPPHIESVSETLAIFAAIQEVRHSIGERAIGPFIISMSRSHDDILTVLALAKWGGLAKDGLIPLDVAPLFETVDDLENAAGILRTLFEIPSYCQHLAARDNRQIVMIGYSDSGKDDGIGSARWALHQAQERIRRVAEANGVDLTIFHGRGGTVSRGGGRLDRAVAAAPDAYANGQLRVTVQGEVINQRYGLRDIAERTTEQMFAPIALAAAGVVKDHHKEAWSEIGQIISEKSREAYRSLIHESPEFFSYFRSATPIDVIERMRIGSRPSSRRAQTSVGDLRAIPWVFAWTQSRHLLTGWYGIGTGLCAAIERCGREPVREALENWPYLIDLLSDVEADLASADLCIAASYAELAPTADRVLFEKISEEHARVTQTILDLKNAGKLLEKDEVLRRSIELRVPYLDPLSLLQVDLLRRWRATDRQDKDLLSQIVGTINGIAQGMQSTG